jgi:hypothetical protein
MVGVGNFYLDIETTGLEPKDSKIITTQYQELDRNSGRATGGLVILKEWESSEKEILSEFIGKSGIADDYPFRFIPTGYNLGFEHNFLIGRAEANGLEPIDILHRPFIDLRAFGIIMNRGEFKGSGLDRISGKKTSGSRIPEWYEKKEYDKIIEYIEDETKSFIHLNAWLYSKMPEFLEQYRHEIWKE